MADATQQGVSTEQQDKPIDTENLTVDEGNLPPRLRSMESIRVKRDDDEDEPAATPDDQQLAAQLESDSSPDQAAPEPKVLADGLDQMLVTVKIDGVERQVSVADMQRQFQKNGAAEKRLEEATRLLNEARERSQQQPDPPVGVAQDGAKKDSTQAPEGGEDGAQAFLKSLFEGDEEKATAALNSLLAGRNQTVPTLPSEQELAAKLTPVIRQQLLQESALEKFAVDNPDIVQDPHLADLADEFLDAEVNAGTPYDKALESAAKKTRDWLASKGVKPPEPTPTMTRDAKLERKAGIEKIPTLNKAASSTAEPAQTTADVIAEMRKSRGLAA